MDAERPSGIVFGPILAHHAAGRPLAMPSLAENLTTTRRAA
jgi:hypothetical protein